MASEIFQRSYHCPRASELVSFRLILGDDRRVDKVANRSRSADTQARNFLSAILTGMRALRSPLNVAYPYLVSAGIVAQRTMPVSLIALS